MAGVGPEEYRDDELGDLVPKELLDTFYPVDLLDWREKYEEKHKESPQSRIKRTPWDKRISPLDKVGEICKKEFGRGRIRSLQRVYSSFMGNELTRIAQRTLFLTLIEDVLLRALGREFNWTETGVLFGVNLLYSMYYGVDKSPR